MSKLGGHILNGDEENERSGGHRAGTGRPGESEFPEDWSDEKIMDVIADIATDPNSRREPGIFGRTKVSGTRYGIDVDVILSPEGRIIT